MSSKWPPAADPSAGSVRVVAEIGPNHAGDYERAAELVRVAAAAGADAVKLQLYEATHMTVDSDDPAYRLPDDGLAWSGRRLYELYTQGSTPVEWYPRLAEVGQEVDVPVFASVFHSTTIQHLERYDCPAYKVASAEVEDPWLLHALKATAPKPVILSDGVASRQQLAWAVRTLGMRQNTVLHCVSGYPAHPALYDLDLLSAYGRFFSSVGVSDHTLGNALAVAAVARGATMLEKHIMLEGADYESPPLDAGHSIGPDQFAQYVAAVREAEKLRQQPMTVPTPKAWRRRIVAVRDISERQMLREGDLRTARCAEGLSATEIDHVLGRRVAHDVAKGQPLQEGDLEPPRS